MACIIPVGNHGLPFNINGTVVWFCLTETQIKQILCHGLSNHGIGVSGGFYGGKNSILYGKGVAIGQDAQVIPAELGTSINAIQIGEGINSEHKTLKIFEWLLLDEYGIIPKERLPEFDLGDVNIDPLSAERKSKVYTHGVYTIDAKIEKHLIDTTAGHVDLVLPKASDIDGLGFYFRLFKQGVDSFAFKVERSQDDKIIIDGSEWFGVSLDEVGEWFYIVSANDNYYLMSESDKTKLIEV